MTETDKPSDQVSSDQGEKILRYRVSVAVGIVDDALRLGWRLDRFGRLYSVDDDGSRIRLRFDDDGEKVHLETKPILSNDDVKEGRTLRDLPPWVPIKSVVISEARATASGLEEMKEGE